MGLRSFNIQSQNFSKARIKQPAIVFIGMYKRIRFMVFSDKTGKPSLWKG